MDVFKAGVILPGLLSLERNNHQKYFCGVTMTVDPILAEHGVGALTNLTNLATLAA